MCWLRSCPAAESALLPVQVCVCVCVCVCDWMTRCRQVRCSGVQLPPLRYLDSSGHSSVHRYYSQRFQTSHMLRHMCLHML